MKITTEKGKGLDYECPVCGNDIELGQNYCIECGEAIEWKEEFRTADQEPECDDCLCPSCNAQCDNAGFEMGVCPYCEGQAMYMCKKYKCSKP